jgi:2'-5' RNA ligase/GNAT superfamily N-acetyltransferase
VEVPVNLSELFGKIAAEDAGVYRGLSLVLPPHIHKMVHDPAQPAASRAHLLLSEIRKQKESHAGEEGASGPAGGLGSFWTPHRNKAEEYATQNGFSAYREHENEHRCGDEDYGDGGCPTTRVVVHAHTPAEKHQWKEIFRPGERYDPAYSWRLPIRPGTPMRVRSISWKEGKDSQPPEQKYSEEGMAAERLPYESYDFLGDVRKKAGANGDLPEGLQLSFHPHYTNESWLPRQDTGERDTFHKVTAHVPGEDGQPVYAGEMSWYPKTGEVALVRVQKPFRRRGIGTAMWNHGTQMAKEQGLTPPRHSEAQTDAGEAWARTTAAYVTPGTMGTDNEGHRVQMTTMDGWAHDDGSHGHEDNTTINDHPVYTQDHTWLPNGRYWGPNSAQNDQRIFEGDHLRPEVREDILSRVNSFLRPRYHQWPSWTRVYFAGSEAAKFQPFNGDFDVLLGADFDKFRQENPKYADQDDDAIAKMITDGMWHTINEDGHWFTLADGRKVGPFDMTFFLDAKAWDIRDIKPYAAYNVTADEWAVHPLEVPKDWDATHLPESYWGYAEAVLNEIKAIGQLPPEERHRMAANLWEELHTHRSDAFNGDGKGLFDLSNVIEKFLDQHPDKPWAQLVQWKNESPSGPEPWVPTTARRTILSMLFDAKTKEPEGADYDGIMIAIVPPKSVGKKLLVEDGEPLDALHVTLCYLGNSSEYSAKQVRELEDLVRAWSRMQKPFEAKVGGAGTFHNPEKHVLMAHVDIPGGGGIRHSLSELLEEHGYNVRNDHGWTPHITLKYHKQPVRFLPKVEPSSWSVGEVMVCIGGKWTPVALGA